MNSPKHYEERYCLFLDILGFQSHVDDSTAPNVGNNIGMNFHKLRSVLNRISDGVNYREGMEVSGKSMPTSRCVTQFSDSVVISYLKDEQQGRGVSSLLLDVHRLQLDLISSGVLLRGAIVSGLLYHDKHLVFGPALNEAVALEKLASYPRVILDGQILEEVGMKYSKRPGKTLSLSRSISSMAARDFDGLYYVDYFNVHPDDFSEDWNDLYEYLESLRRLVKSLANKKDPSLKVKHSWLRTKFNDMLEPLAKAGFHEIAGHSVPDDDIELFRQLKPF